MRPLCFNSFAAQTGGGRLCGAKTMAAERQRRGAGKSREETDEVGSDLREHDSGAAALKAGHVDVKMRSLF
jgi:hypothetical protein